MSPNTADILIDVCVFFASAGDDEVDPDAAVRQLEEIAYALRQAPNADRVGFLERLKERTHAAAGHERATLSELAENLGLA